MPEFKLISADSHVNEPPAAWERVQKEYGERAPKVVGDPPAFPKACGCSSTGFRPSACPTTRRAGSGQRQRHLRSRARKAF